MEISKKQERRRRSVALCPGPALQYRRKGGIPPAEISPLFETPQSFIGQEVFIFFPYIILMTRPSESHPFLRLADSRRDIDKKRWGAKQKYDV